MSDHPHVTGDPEDSDSSNHDWDLWEWFGESAARPGSDFGFGADLDGGAAAGEGYATSEEDEFGDGEGGGLRRLGDSSGLPDFDVLDEGAAALADPSAVDRPEFGHVEPLSEQTTWPSASEEDGEVDGIGI